MKSLVSESQRGLLNHCSSPCPYGFLTILSLLLIFLTLFLCPKQSAIMSPIDNLKNLFHSLTNSLACLDLTKKKKEKKRKALYLKTGSSEKPGECLAAFFRMV